MHPHALEGAVAVVTGASSGVGRAVAVALAKGGASLWLVGRHPERLEQAAAETCSNGAAVETHRADLTVDEDIQALAQRVEREAGRVDVLVHSAAVIEIGETASASVEDFDLQYRTNLRAPFALTQAMLPMLVASRGQVAFVNSTAGLRAAPGASQYSATKRGLAALADSLRVEVSESGVRVLTMFLGRTATPMQEALHKTEGRPYRPETLVQPEDAAQMLVGALALPRTADVTDITLPSRAPPR